MNCANITGIFDDDMSRRWNIQCTTVGLWCCKTVLELTF